MGGEGHIADMEQRLKQNRELRQQRRERTRETMRTMYKESHLTPANFSVEKLELADKEIAVKKRSDEWYNFRLTLIILGALVLISLLVYALLI